MSDKKNKGKKSERSGAKFQMNDCPLCGSDMRVGTVDAHDVSGWDGESDEQTQFDVRCTDKLCLLSSGLPLAYDTPRIAVDDWNAGSEGATESRGMMAAAVLVMSNDLKELREEHSSLASAFDDLLSLTSRKIFTLTQRNTRLTGAVGALSDVVTSPDGDGCGCADE